jgi:hypothetical protein
MKKKLEMFIMLLFFLSCKSQQNSKTENCFNLKLNLPSYYVVCSEIYGHLNSPPSGPTGNSYNVNRIVYKDSFNSNYILLREEGAIHLDNKNETNYLSELKDYYQELLNENNLSFFNLKTEKLSNFNNAYSIEFFYIENNIKKYFSHSEFYLEDRYVILNFYMEDFDKKRLFEFREMINNVEVFELKSIPKKFEKIDSFNNCEDWYEKF